MEILNGIQRTNADGSIDYDNGYTLETNGILYDNNNNIVASDVISFNDTTGIVTYSGGNTETLQEIANGGTLTQQSTPGQSFWSSKTPLILGIGLLFLSFVIKDKK